MSRLSVSFSQIEQGGYPKYFNSSPDREIKYITVNQEEKVDRNFHPMVFQFGEEYNLDVKFLDEAMVSIDDGVHTFILGLSSSDAYGIGINFSDFFLTENAELYFYDRERTSFLGS